MEEITLNDPTSLRAYAHPLRLSLIGLLRSNGPMTATQCAAALDENVPNCSFHLRQLAKYGLAERAPGADARERPWRATAKTTSWTDDSDNPELKAAVDQLNGVLLQQYVRRAEAYLARRVDEPVEWRRAAGFGDTMIYLTAEELADLTARIDALCASYLHDARQQPEGARPVTIVQLAIPS